jgi:hypothetical protein
MPSSAVLNESFCSGFSVELISLPPSIVSRETPGKKNLSQFEETQMRLSIRIGKLPPEAKVR